MVRALTGILAAAALLTATGPATAQVVFEFADSSGAVKSSFSVLPGSTIPIRVYLHDKSAGAAQFNSDGGLGSGAVRLSYSNPALAGIVLAGPANNPTNPQPAVPPWAGGTDNGSTASSAVLSDLSNNGSGTLPDAAGRILLGTFTFTAGSTGGSETLTLANPNNAGFNTSSFGTDSGFVPLINYDPQLTAGGPYSATLTVTPVPEPTTLALAGFAAAGIALRRRKK